MRCIRLIAFTVLITPGFAFAHHGQDFLLLESPGIPHLGDVYLIANAQAALERGAEEQAAFEPALLFGATQRIAFELHAHTEKLAGEHWTYEATAPAVHIMLTDPSKHHGFKVGMSGEYEFAREEAGADRAELRLSLESGDPAYKWAANLIASGEQHANAEFGASLGFRHQVRPGLAFGAEALGSFEHAAGAQLLAGAYFEHQQSLAVKIGLGGERDDGGRFMPIAHLGVVIRLRD